MKILNLGCGTKTSPKEEVLNLDWSMYLRLKRSKLASLFVPIILRGERLEKFRSIPDNVIVCNLAKGIPFEDNSMDVVYHSHMLEHLDRDAALDFLQEVKRVLKPGGIHRIVVPDFEQICRRYLSHLEACETACEEAGHHDEYVGEVLEQSVRREAFGTTRQKPFRRWIENVILGDARQRGETHQWMYDRISIRHKLVDLLGYRHVHMQSYNTSLISGWNDYVLDVDSSGNQYKPYSLYIEAVK